MKHLNKTLPVLVALGLIVPASSASAAAETGKNQVFKLVPSGISRVSFESDAPIENIVGITSAVTGEISVNLSKPKDKPKGTVTVDLTTVKTGIKKRDAHMRSKDFLNTDKYPTASFTLERLQVEGVIAGRRGVDATLYGKFSLHGVTRNVKLKVKLGHRVAGPQLAKFGVKGDVLRIKGSFELKMSDYGIKVPSKLGAKVSNTVKISLALTAYTG